MRDFRAIALLTCAASLALTACGGGGGGGGRAQPALPSAPLTAATIAPALAAPNGGEIAASSDAFVDSAGMNVRLANFLTLYGNFATVAALLEGLGVRHIRDGTDIGQPAVCADDTQLAAAGIHIDLIAGTGIAIPALQSWTSCLGSAIEAVENPNEYDGSGNPAWVSVLTAYAPLLYPAMKPAPVIAPALTTEQNFVALGSLSSSVDEGNMHDYFAGRNPGTPGWGGTDAHGEYGSLAYNESLAAVTSGGKPVVATETGYSDAADQYAVPPATKARYTLRTLFEHWNAGVVRTYFFELADEGAAPFSHYGLVDAAGNPKPAYVALKNLLAHLADPGGAFVTAPLAYTLGAASTVHHTLLQKRNGRYVLALWVEQPEWDPDTSAPVAVPAQAATLTFTVAPHALATTVFDDGGNVSSAPLTLDAGSAALQVTAAPTLVDITP